MLRICLPVHIGDVICFHFCPVNARSLNFGSPDFHIWVGSLRDGERQRDSPAHSPKCDALNEQDCLSIFMTDAEAVVLLECDALGIEDRCSCHTAVRSDGRFAIPLDDDWTVSVDSESTS